MATAVFIDGGYLTVIERFFGEPRLDYEKLARWCCGDDSVFRTYYYNCLPWQSPQATEEERRRLANKQSFFTTLNRLPRFTVRLGRLHFRGLKENGEPLFEQKRVDIMLGLDVAGLVYRNRVTRMVFIASDSDYVPAFELAKQEGISIKLVHGPRETNYSIDLWEAADDREGITPDVIQSLLR